ncbi:MAG: hypothetical protein J6J62_04210 [Oscillospiraceae bacterium]|nr:hypothetical protein [Oscillospiraceae bacterium]
MPKLSLRTFAAILLAACLMRALFPSLKAPVSAAFAKLTGIDRSPELLIETMGSDLSTEGLHNTIVYAFDYAFGGEVYPAAGVK